MPVSSEASVTWTDAASLTCTQAVAGAGVHDAVQLPALEAHGIVALWHDHRAFLVVAAVLTFLLGIEEPSALIVHARICGGAGSSNRPVYPTNS